MIQIAKPRMIPIVRSRRVMGSRQTFLRIFVPYVGSTPTVVASCFPPPSWYDCGEALRGKHYASTRKQETADTALIGRLTRRLFGEACQLGIGNGYSYIDLGGLNPIDPAKRGASQFKQSFGGETVEINIYRRAAVLLERVAEHVEKQGMAVL